MKLKPQPEKNIYNTNIS